MSTKHFLHQSVGEPLQTPDVLAIKEALYFRKIITETRIMEITVFVFNLRGVMYMTPHVLDADQLQRQKLALYMKKNKQLFSSNEGGASILQFLYTFYPKDLSISRFLVVTILEVPLTNIF